MNLRAGAAEVDITPPFPVDLLGYVRRSTPDVAGMIERTALELLDELFA